MQPKHWTAFIFLGVIWSASFLWIKIALNEIGPNHLVAWRVLFGSVICWWSGLPTTEGLAAQIGLAGFPSYFLA